MITSTYEPMKDENFKKNLTPDDSSHLEEDAWEFIKSVVKAEKIKRKQFGTLENVHIRMLDLKDDVHITNLPYLCKLLNFSYIREDWDGNEHCNSNYDILYFMYKGFKFFELEERRNNAESKNSELSGN